MQMSATCFTILLASLRGIIMLFVSVLFVFLWMDVIVICTLSSIAAIVACAVLFTPSILIVSFFYFVDLFDFLWHQKLDLCWIPWPLK